MGSKLKFELAKTYLHLPQSLEEGSHLDQANLIVPDNDPRLLLDRLSRTLERVLEHYHRRLVMTTIVQVVGHVTFKSSAASHDQVLALLNSLATVMGNELPITVDCGCAVLIDGRIHSEMEKLLSKI